MEGANIFDLVEGGSHNRLRRLLEENLGSVSKEAIASALRHQGTTFEALLARSEKAKEQGDSSFFSASGEPPLFPWPPSAPASEVGIRKSDTSSNNDGGCAGGGRSFIGSNGGGTVDLDGSTDDCWESEANNNSACEGSSHHGRARSSASSGMMGGSGGSGSGGGTSEIDSSGTGGSGGVGWGAGIKLLPSRAKRRSLPPLGPAAFSVRPKAAAADGGGAGGGGTSGARQQRTGSGGRSSIAFANAAVPPSFSAAALPFHEKKANGVGVVPAFVAKSEKSPSLSSAEGRDGTAAENANVVSVDRDLQSKINAFTNNQKVLCLFISSVFCCCYFVGHVG